MAEMAASMGDEEGNGGEEDPRKMAAVMQKFFDATGVKPNDTMLEAMARMQAGEDPDKIDEDLGEAMDTDDPFDAENGTLKQRMQRYFDQPRIDPELYDL